jgi:cation diffusion facilitator CzcD-associated flavoprotein CzcO
MSAEHAAQASLRLLGLGGDWIELRPGVDHDVVIVGGGQSGVAIAHGLRQAGVARVSVVDAGRGPSESPWRTRARMLTLRTAKSITGPELGNAALSFRAWFESRHGAAAFAALDRIRTGDWADYLDWYRAQVGVQVRYGTRVTAIASGGTGVRLDLHDGTRSWSEVARKVVLATGVSGTGGPNVPDALRALPRSLWAHTADAIEFAALRGRSVAVLGAAASAFDAAAAALDAGAGEVHVYTRRPQLVIADGSAVRNPLLHDVFHLLPDAERWTRRHQIAAAGASVPADSVTRVTAHPRHRIHVSAPWHSAEAVDGRVRVRAADGVAEFDFVIAGTGYQQDPATRPELASLAPHVALWRDVYTPPPGLEHDILGATPYLGPDYQFTERSPGTAPWLRDLHVFSIGATVSFGRPVGDVPSLRVGVPKLVSALTRDLVLADLGVTLPDQPAELVAR